MERSVFDVFLLILFGTIGYFMLRYGYSPPARRSASCSAPAWRPTCAPACCSSAATSGSSPRPWTATILSCRLALLDLRHHSTLKLARREAMARKLALEAHLRKGARPGS